MVRTSLQCFPKSIGKWDLDLESQLMSITINYFELVTKAQIMTKFSEWITIAFV
jgi:hypothetical protein